MGQSVVHRESRRDIVNKSVVHGFEKVYRERQKEMSKKKKKMIPGYTMYLKSMLKFWKHFNLLN